MRTLMQLVNKKRGRGVGPMCGSIVSNPSSNDVTLLSRRSRVRVPRTSDVAARRRLRILHNTISQPSIRISPSSSLNQRHTDHYTFLTLYVFHYHRASSCCIVRLAWLPRGVVFTTLRSATVLVFGQTSSKRLKVKEKVAIRYLTHEQRSDTMRGSTKGCQLHF